MISSSVDKDISPDDKENFHEFLRWAADTFTQIVYRTKNSTYNLLKPLERNKDIVLLSDDKDSSAVTLDKACYIKWWYKKKSLCNSRKWQHINRIKIFSKFYL